MKKLTLLVVAGLLLSSGAAFAEGKCCKKGKHCCKDKKECAKDSKESKANTGTETKQEAAPKAKS